MPQSLVEIANELTLALLQTWRIPLDSMQETLQQTYTMLTTLKSQEAAGPAAALSSVQPPTVDWRTSITRHAVTCLECGHAFKQMTIRHLRLHGLDPSSYRVKYGIPRLQSLVSWKTSSRRRQVVRQTRPWESAPAYLQRHARNATESPAPKVETRSGKAETYRFTSLAVLPGATSEDIIAGTFSKSKVFAKMRSQCQAVLRQRIDGSDEDPSALATTSFTPART